MKLILPTCKGLCCTAANHDDWDNKFDDQYMKMSDSFREAHIVVVPDENYISYLTSLVEKWESTTSNHEKEIQVNCLRKT